MTHGFSLHHLYIRTHFLEQFAGSQRILCRLSKHFSDSGLNHRFLTRNTPSHGWKWHFIDKNALSHVKRLFSGQVGGQRALPPQWTHRWQPLCILYSSWAHRQQWDHWWSRSHMPRDVTLLALSLDKHYRNYSNLVDSGWCNRTRRRRWRLWSTCICVFFVPEDWCYCVGDGFVNLKIGFLKRIRRSSNDRLSMFISITLLKSPSGAIFLHGMQSWSAKQIHSNAGAMRLHTVLVHEHIHFVIHNTWM